MSRFSWLPLCLLLVSCLSRPPLPRLPQGGAPPTEEPSLPLPPREFRGLWVASVYNLDWPSKPGLPALELAREADRILDLATSFGFNAILLQVRPAGDALYTSSFEPWSSVISGRQGEAPPEGFDPLAYWLSGARRRGLLLFAWINPFRVGLPGTIFDVRSPVLAKPEIVREVGKGYRWLDPGEPAARDYVVSVALDLVGHYDVDGVVLDDYLYPYASILGRGEAFPDASSYRDYRTGGGSLPIGEWRVEQGNAFMRLLASHLQREYPRLILGASPFGIYRSGLPEGIRGLSGRDETGADALAWAAEGLVDFLAPQLYWPATAIEQSYPLLLAWWKEALSSSRKNRDTPIPRLWPSLAPAAQRLDAALKPHEALSELMTARAILGGEGRGVLIYSARALLDPGNGIAGALKPAFVSRTLPPELPASAPSPRMAAPLLADCSLDEEGLRLSLEVPDQARWLLVYERWGGAAKNDWSLDLRPAEEEVLVLRKKSGAELLGLALALADARGRISEPLFIDPKDFDPPRH